MKRKSKADIIKDLINSQDAKGILLKTESSIPNMNRQLLLEQEPCRKCGNHITNHSDFGSNEYSCNIGNCPKGLGPLV